jgi:hypothetical protein
MQDDKRTKLVDEAAAKLAEHFDSVIILASSTEERITRMWKAGRGDWYSQQGMAQEFITRDQASVFAEAQHSEPEEE